MSRPQVIDWDYVFRSLERGLSVSRISKNLKVGNQTLRFRLHELSPAQQDRFNQLAQRNRDYIRRTTRLVPIDWDLVFRQLHAGHQISDIARWTVRMSHSHLGKRAQRELTPRQLAELHALAKRNAIAARPRPECGTYGGLQAHWRRKEPACEPCLATDRLRPRRERKYREQGEQAEKSA